MKKRGITTFSLILCVALLLSFASCGMASSAPMGNAAYDSISGEYSDESYTEIVENPYVNTMEMPDSYFSIDVNSASYPNIRRYINNNYIHFDKDAVRIEEMLNYFDYDYKTPDDGSVLALTSSVFDTPYNENTKLLTIGLAAEEIEFQDIENNLVFLIDVSGSMRSSNKLPLVQQAFSLLTENLNPNDRVSIVTYAGSDKIVLKGAYGHEKEKILDAINSLEASGSTAGSFGILTAYSLASKYFIQGGNNRVILATDGDFNVGITGIGGLEGLISRKAESGVYFSVFGFGPGNIKADKMEALALKGNGTWGYIDSIKEAERQLVKQIGATLVTVAKDVKAGITFDPEYVESYRLVGYENKQLTQDEFEDSNTDAGEIGSGFKLTVVYEVVLTEKGLDAGATLADVIIKYKPTENVGGDAQTEEQLTLSIGSDSYHSEPSAQDKFISSVVEFGLILRESAYKGNANLEALIERLDSLDFANDEDKADFRETVEKYYELWIAYQNLNKQ